MLSFLLKVFSIYYKKWPDEAGDLCTMTKRRLFFLSAGFGGLYLQSNKITVAFKVNLSK